MKHKDNPLAHKEWKPLLDETSKPFDQTNGATKSAEDVPAEFDDKLFLLEKGFSVTVLEAVQLAERDVPDYIEVDHNKMTATFVRTPALGDVPYAVQMEPNLVVEYYAQN